MRAALYARVSTESQEQKGTIGSQLEVLRARIAAEGHELVAEYCDDGISGARLDRPGLDRLRDEAEAGVFEVVWCASPDRLARAYPYQVLILDELARLGVQVCFVDAPMLDDDSQLKLLTQVQGVIAEWERAKIAERNRRGKLYRSRAGEIISWKAPYGYRRVPKGPQGPAYLEVFEPEAAVVRRIFDEYVTGGRSIRQITVGLAEDGVVSPSGVALWHTATLGRLLRNEALRGTRLLQPHTSHSGRLQNRPPGQPAAASAQGGMDPHLGARHGQRRGLRSGPTSGQEQHQLQPTQPENPSVAVARTGGVRRLRRAGFHGTRPRSSRGERAALLLLLQPRPVPGRQRRAAMPRTPHPCRRARRVRLRSDPPGLTSSRHALSRGGCRVIHQTGTG